MATRAEQRAQAAGDLAAAIGLRADQAHQAMRLAGRDRRARGHRSAAPGPKSDPVEGVAAVVRAFDDLVNGTRGGLPATRAFACAALVRGAGARFHPDIVRAWLQLQDETATRHVH